MNRCARCGRDIEEGADYWCVAVHRERDREGGIDVLFADEALRACLMCFPSYDQRDLLTLATALAARAT